MMKACEMILAKMAERHPEIPAELFRWSLAYFHWYIALKCWRSSDYPGTLHHLTQIVQQDKLHLLNVGFYRVSFSTITHLLRKRLKHFASEKIALPDSFKTSLGQLNWNQFREQYSQPDQETDLETPQQQKEQENQPIWRKYFYWMLERRIRHFQQRQYSPAFVAATQLKLEKS